jgi:hypothetical protein
MAQMHNNTDTHMACSGHRSDRHDGCLRPTLAASFIPSSPEHHHTTQRQAQLVQVWMLPNKNHTTSMHCHCISGSLMCATRTCLHVLPPVQRHTQLPQSCLLRCGQQQTPEAHSMAGHGTVSMTQHGTA